MEEVGISSLIQEPLDWCAGMVPVRKKNGQIGICMDLTQLNESVKRQLHPLLDIHVHVYETYEPYAFECQFMRFRGHDKGPLVQRATFIWKYKTWQST